MAVGPSGPIEKVPDNKFPLLCHICLYERRNRVVLETKELGLLHRKQYHPWIAEYMAGK